MGNEKMTMGTKPNLNPSPFSNFIPPSRGKGGGGTAIYGLYRYVPL